MTGALSFLGGFMAGFGISQLAFVSGQAFAYGAIGMIGVAIMCYSLWGGDD